MEISPRLLQPIPFYLSYPGYLEPGKEAHLLQDMEYLQQMYPDAVKKCQRRVAEILDRTDYEGSVIYDEYPDRLCLLHLADSMQRTLEQEGMDPSKEVIQLLLLNEIYKRRHGGRRGRIF